jgi:hypothetical protein
MALFLLETLLSDEVAGMSTRLIDSALPPQLRQGCIGIPHLKVKKCSWTFESVAFLIRK